MLENTDSFWYTIVNIDKSDQYTETGNKFVDPGTWQVVPILGINIQTLMIGNNSSIDSSDGYIEPVEWYTNPGDGYIDPRDG